MNGVKISEKKMLKQNIYTINEGNIRHKELCRFIKLIHWEYTVFILFSNYFSTFIKCFQTLYII